MRAAALLRRRRAGVVGSVADYDADSLVGLADAAAVSALASSVGSDTLVQATGGNQPTKQTDSGLTVVRFDGVNDRLQITTGAHSQPMTTVIVAKLNATAGTPVLVDGGNTNFTHDVGSTTDFIAYAGTTLDSGVALDTNWHIVVAIFNGASSNIRVDGGAGVTGNAGAAGRTGLTIGSAFSGTLPASMDFRRLITFDRALTAGELNILGPALLAHSPGLLTTWNTAS